MLMRTDPFREFDRMTQQLFGAKGTGPVRVMPMDAYRKGESSSCTSTCPGSTRRRSSSTSNATCSPSKRSAPRPTGDGSRCRSPSARGVFSRQLFLGDALDADRIEASYDAGVLTLRIPIAEKAKPRKIEITGGGEPKKINARS